MKNFLQVFSHFLIILIVSISVTRILHHHCNSAIEYAQDDLKLSFDKTLAKCGICEYLAQGHSKEFLLPFVPALNITSINCIEILANVIAGNGLFAPQGFSNKGPPARVKNSNVCVHRLILDTSSMPSRIDRFFFFR